MQDSKTWRHVLIIEDSGRRRAFVLGGGVYSIGRDPTNTIILNSSLVSRQHALLIRMPTSGSEGYRYQIVDGNAQGKRSSTGLTVNGVSRTSWDLRDADRIIFGGQIEARYYVRLMSDQEFSSQTEFPEVRSIKSDPVDTVPTKIGSEDI